MRIFKTKLQVVPSVSGHDRWLFVWKNTIRWAWDAPRWMSFVSKNCGF